MYGCGKRLKVCRGAQCGGGMAGYLVVDGQHDVSEDLAVRLRLEAERQAVHLPIGTCHMTSKQSRDSLELQSGSRVELEGGAVPRAVRR